MAGCFRKTPLASSGLGLLNQTTGGRIEHWYVAGTVDLKNDYDDAGTFALAHPAGAG